MFRLAASIVVTFLNATKCQVCDMGLLFACHDFKYGQLLVDCYTGAGLETPYI